MIFTIPERNGVKYLFIFKCENINISTSKI